jgi:APA family basic amino acid/polyamine antiporter
VNQTSEGQLTRAVGVRLAVVVVVGNILGSGIYKKVAPMATELGSPTLVILCWIAGGLISLFGALSSAELAGIFADTGGEYVYFKKIYNRFFAFIYGWTSYAVIKNATIASLAYVFSQSLHEIVHFPDILTAYSNVNLSGIFYPFAGLNVKLVAIALILLLTYFNTFGIRTGMNLSVVLLALELLGVFTIIIFGLTSKESNPTPVFTSISDVPFSISSFLTAMLAAFFAYEGWNSVGFVAGEIKNPNKNIPISLSVGMMIVIGLYVTVNITYLSILEIPTLVSIYKSQHQIAAVEAVRTFWGTGGATLISILILVTTLGCNHASVISNSRIYYAMAKDKLFFKKVDTVNKYKVPAMALWFQGVWAIVLVMSGTFDQLTDMAMFAAFIFYGATALGVIILRIRMPEAPRAYKVPGYPIVPVLFVLFCAGLVFNSVFTRPREALIASVLIGTGVPLYYYFRRSSNSISNL